MSHKRRRKNRKKEDPEDSEIYRNDEFAYIVGYTGWGYPYGTTWEEMGIDPELPFEEKVKLLEKKEQITDSTTDSDDALKAALDDLLF